jgi:hypothetical protein
MAESAARLAVLIDADNAQPSIIQGLLADSPPTLTRRRRGERLCARSCTG